MGRANRDVGGYRGRRTVTDILKLIAIILGVLTRRLVISVGKGIAFGLILPELIGTIRRVLGGLFPQRRD